MELTRNNLGTWWLPDDPTRRVAGTFVVDPSGRVALELVGVLREGQSNVPYDVVLGTTTDGDAVTLTDVAPAGSTTRSSTYAGSQTFESFVAGRALVGWHLATEDERAFIGASVEFAWLHEWAGKSGLAEHREGTADVTLTYTRPEEMVASLPWCDVALSRGWTLTGDLLRERTIGTTVAFRATRTQPAALDDWVWGFVRPLRHFMTFATDRVAEVSRMHVTSTHMDDLQPAEVIYQRVAALDPDRPRRSDFLFDFAAIRPRFAEVLARWYETAERLGLVMDLFLGPRYLPDTFLDNHFLNVVAAAEGYHRAMTAHVAVPEGEAQPNQGDGRRCVSA